MRTFSSMMICALLVIACKDPSPGDGSTGSASSSSGAAPTTSTGETPTTTTPTTTGDATTGAAAACDCAASMVPAGGCMDDDDKLWMQVPECALAMGCPRVTVTCPRPGEDLYDCQDELVFADEALTCVLTAMRDRTPGRFIVEGSVGGVHSFRELFAVRLRGDDTAVVSECTGGSGGSLTGYTSVLPAPASFDACLAETEPRKRHACVREALQQKVTLPACAGE